MCHFFQSLSNIGDKNGIFYTLTKSLGHQACWAKETLCSILRIIFKKRKLKYSISNDVSVNCIMSWMKYFQSWKKKEKFCTTWKIKQNPVINARMEPQSSALSPYFIHHKFFEYVPYSRFRKKFWMYRSEQANKL